MVVKMDQLRSCVVLFFLNFTFRFIPLISLSFLLVEWRAVIKQHHKLLKEIGERKSNESLRIGPMKANQMFGLDGSFKKLNLD